MSLIRWSPMRDEVDRMFDLLFPARPLAGWRGGVFDDGTYGSFWTPAVDIAEHEDAYVVEAELPGLTKDDVKISIDGDVLTIKGERKQEQTKNGKNYHRTERTYGSFMRSFTLPSSVKTDKIEANYKNGILTINLPKAEEAKPKAVEVKVQ